jgi:cell division protein FtsL
MDSDSYAIFMLSFVPVMALALMGDCALRLTLRLAGMLGLKRPDGMLLILTLLAAMAWLLWSTQFPIWDSVLPSRIHRAAFDAAVAADQARQRQVMLFLYFDGAAIVLCAIASVWLAVRQKRSLILWLLMGIFGTAGSVIWLMVNRRRA